MPDKVFGTGVKLENSTKAEKVAQEMLHNMLQTFVKHFNELIICFPKLDEQDALMLVINALNGCVTTILEAIGATWVTVKDTQELNINSEEEREALLEKLMKAGEIKLPNEAQRKINVERLLMGFLVAFGGTVHKTIGIENMTKLLLILRSQLAQVNKNCETCTGMPCNPFPDQRSNKPFLN